MKKLVLALLMLPLPAWAEFPMIEDAIAAQSGRGWSFSVTLLHPDSGWDHYADGWQVLDVDDNVLGYRELVHPHVNEQPFTRSLSGVKIPDGMTTIYIRAHCGVDGWGEQRFEVKLGE